MCEEWLFRRIKFYCEYSGMWLEMNTEGGREREGGRENVEHTPRATADPTSCDFANKTSHSAGFHCGSQALPGCQAMC